MNQRGSLLAVYWLNPHGVLAEGVPGVDGEPIVRLMSQERFSWAASLMLAFSAKSLSSTLL